MLDFIRTYGRLGAVVLSSLAVVALVAVGIVAVVRASNAWEADCKAAGGHVFTSHGVGSGIDPSTGRPVTVVTSDSMCLSADGRILEV
ncbi:hypothetical protein OG474_09875 [Kribbella sp. NBC_01505]|uniref:hypothetical protein n=1 Tax=Kribbella sp. NBC_01505 TaxID=2903580 RepID=UPI00386B2617